MAGPEDDSELVPRDEGGASVEKPSPAPRSSGVRLSPENPENTAGLYPEPRDEVGASTERPSVAPPFRPGRRVRLSPESPDELYGRPSSPGGPDRPSRTDPPSLPSSQ
ncbi:hypothetical protein [Streptomyces varsoviensis]|uniref:hypothetical protein n=1 Tax=Streptomyces varsoviensis TaxID=67373 RepID=UPI000998D65A|nr:hypothetical protein [Streptomyces varsoviensis]